MYVVTESWQCGPNMMAVIFVKLLAATEQNAELWLSMLSASSHLYARLSLLCRIWRRYRKDMSARYREDQLQPPPHASLTAPETIDKCGASLRYDGAVQAMDQVKVDDDDDW